MSRGFTLIEFLIVIVIIAVLSAIIVSSFSGFRNNQVLSGETQEVTSLLYEARGRALASENAQEFGVHLESGKAVLFAGSTYSAGDPDNEETALDSLVEIASIALTGGGNDIIFNRISGTTDENGTFEVRLVDDIANKNTVTVEPSGVISID